MCEMVPYSIAEGTIYAAITQSLEEEAEAMDNFQETFSCSELWTFKHE